MKALEVENVDINISSSITQPFVMYSEDNSHIYPLNVIVKRTGMTSEYFCGLFQKKKKKNVEKSSHE
ncbi:CLUMA_CG000648, isoform A [Clunio marinus]|uniref:CLUMA_CG000648, isoform A n=1 Tax=Clunio marinus TaxID=568069 RepID=A0A1J1HG28_9DIPT|nr:CLUMA_CG000648, isoform A [Clunio marinus]